MTDFPKVNSVDSTFSLFRDPYRFISKRCEELNTDAFQTRLLLKKTICIRSKEAAKIFYDTNHFSRVDVAPSRISKTLFGQGGIQGMDGDKHQHRKKMFMSLLTKDRIGDLTAIALKNWRRRIVEWSLRDKVNLYQQTCELLTESVCQWAGVPLEISEVNQRSNELKALFNYAGNIGPKHWQARLARKRNEAWLKNIIEKIREEVYDPPQSSAAYILANHRNLNGSLLDAQIAAVELNNILRPTVAVAVYVVHCAHALHQNPSVKQHLVNGSDKEYECFVQEVRRFYPFFPFTAAKVKKSFEWQGYKFPQGRRVFLDLYGINHDPRAWQNPDTFNLDRFKNWKEDPFTLVPQGGGNHYENHRCPGEWIAIEQMKVATRMLVSECEYSVPEQNLDLQMDNLPALPKSQFIISNIQLKN